MDQQKEEEGNDEKPTSTPPSSSSSDDDDDDEEEEAMLREIQAIEQRFRDVAEADERALGDPEYYGYHVQLLTLYRAVADFDGLGMARERMIKHFPLSEALWREWIEDEKRFGSSKDKTANLHRLYTLATKEYLSISLWLDRLHFTKANFGEQALHNVMHQAIEVAGWHLSKGNLIWEFCVANAKDRREWISRELSVPLVNIDREALLQQVDGEASRSISDQAQVLAKERQSFEDSLTTLGEHSYEIGSGVQNPELTKAFLAYIHWELSRKRRKEFEKHRIICLFERALACDCLNPDLWIRYLQVLLHRMVDHENIQFALETHERAVRNCPATCSLWLSYMRCLEIKKANEEVFSVLQRAIGVSYNDPNEYLVLLKRACEYYRRCATTSATMDQLKSIFEYSAQFLMTYAQAIGLKPKDKEAAMVDFMYYQGQSRRKVNNADGSFVQEWDQFLQAHPSHRAWAKCLDFFEEYRDFPAYRRFALKALEELKSDRSAIDMVCKKWVNFENAFADDLHHILECERRVASARRELEQRFGRASLGTGKQTSKHPRITADEETKAPIPNTDDVERSEMKTGVESEHDKCSVFVFNLPYEISKDDLGKFFEEDCGPVKHARVLMGKQKGRAIVAFYNHEAAEKAIAKSGSKMNSRTIQVSLLKSREELKSERKGKHDLGLKVLEEAPFEKERSVFISNLKEEVCFQIASKQDNKEMPFVHALLNCGTLEHAKLARNKTSILVRFSSITSADKALKLDEDEQLCRGPEAMPGRRIKLAPPIRNYDPTETVKQKKRKEQAELTPEASGKRKKRKSMIGKETHVNPLNSNDNVPRSGQGKGGDSKRAKSNQDFRRMFFSS